MNTEYKNWNIMQLLEAQRHITVEIQSRVKTIIDMEDQFLTYNPNAASDRYQELIMMGIDLIRKGPSND